MSNPIVTPEMFAIMRKALGLGPWQNTPDRNHVIPDYRGKDDELIEKMIDMELLETRILVGQSRERYIMVTEEGKRLCVEDHNNVNKHTTS